MCVCVCVCGYSTETAESILVAIRILQVQYFKHMIACSLQYVNGSRNPEMTVCRVSWTDEGQVA